MIDRTRILAALAAMPDEAWDWLILACAPSAMLNTGGAPASGANIQIWPDGLGGFEEASRAAIEEVRAAADVYLAEARQ
jgi:hypothetical protein